LGYRARGSIVFTFPAERGGNPEGCTSPVFDDFHIDPGDEIFCPLTGDIVVQHIDPDGKRRDTGVREGEVMLCRAGTPHCPIRSAGTWGLFIERKRRPDELDRLA